MATCKKCGVTFKPYWHFMDVEKTTCEHCAHQEDKKKGQRLFTAFVSLVLGIVALGLGLFYNSFFLQLAGFIVLLFGLLKLIEITIIGQKPSPQSSPGPAARLPE